MQLKFNRSMTEKKGIFGSKKLYQLEAILDLTPEEKASMEKVEANLQRLALGLQPGKKSVEIDWMHSDERNDNEYSLIGSTLNWGLFNGTAFNSEDPLAIEDAEQGLVKAVKNWKSICMTTDSFANSESSIVDL